MSSSLIIHFFRTDDEFRARGHSDGEGWRGARNARGSGERSLLGLATTGEWWSGYGWCIFADEFSRAMTDSSTLQSVNAILTSFFTVCLCDSWRIVLMSLIIKNERSKINIWFQVHNDQDKFEVHLDAQYFTPKEIQVGLSVLFLPRHHHFLNDIYVETEVSKKRWNRAMVED